MDELKNLIEESSAESQVKMKDQLETLIGIPLKQMMLKIAVSRPRKLSQITNRMVLTFDQLVQPGSIPVSLEASWH